MFICDPCLTKNYTNSPNIRRDYGTCEVCNTPGQACSDIRSKHLVRRVKLDQNGIPLAGGVKLVPRDQLSFNDIPVVPRTVIQKNGVVGFREGVALIDGMPLLEREHAGRRVNIKIEVEDA
jgi:hypothetical protein